MIVRLHWSCTTVNDSVAFPPHLLLTVWGLLCLLSSPPAFPLTPFSFIFLSRPLAQLTTARPSPFTSKQHSLSFLLHFFPPSISPLALFSESFALSFSSPEPSLLPGDPSPIADSHRPRCPPPNHRRHPRRRRPIPPLSLSFCRFCLTALLHPP